MPVSDRERGALRRFTSVTRVRAGYAAHSASNTRAARVSHVRRRAGHLAPGDALAETVSRWTADGTVRLLTRSPAASPHGRRRRTGRCREVRAGSAGWMFSGAAPSKFGVESAQVSARHTVGPYVSDQRGGRRRSIRRQRDGRPDEGARALEAEEGRSDDQLSDVDRWHALRRVERPKSRLGARAPGPVGRDRCVELGPQLRYAPVLA